MNEDVSNTPTPVPSREGPDRRRTYRVRHGEQTPARLSTTIVHALADVMDENVTDVEYSLHDVIDPAALNHLFAATNVHGHPAGHVAFCVRGYQVTVYATGDIVITPPVVGGAPTA